ncbi:DMT family transporter [Streptomyces apocyni]|uniref:DMT family transporter n=1 Tax=Streptomyces apocyni TaxID=2654677 RepID=UPI001E2A924A|nr:DMT family transporter [Streptomyces apocyni]
MSALALSVLLSLVSAVAYAGGAILQERVAVTSPDRPYAPLRRPVWWVAVALNGVGAVLHVAALALGPLSLVQPLGALTIVFALPMAALFVGRRAGSTAWRGAIMATVGLAGLLALTGAAGSHSLDATQRVLVAAVTFGVVAALVVAARTVHRHPVVRSVLLAGGAGVAFGIASVFTKTVAVDWSTGGILGQLPSLSVIGVLATAGLLLSQAAYRGAGLAAPLATVTVVNPAVAAAVGLTLFQESFRYGTTGTLLALGCSVVAAGGLILLTTERMGDTADTARTATTGQRQDQLPTGAERLAPLAAPLAVAPRGQRRAKGSAPVRAASAAGATDVLERPMVNDAWPREPTAGAPPGVPVQPKPPSTRFRS